MSIHGAGENSLLSETTCDVVIPALFRIARASVSTPTSAATTMNLMMAGSAIDVPSFLNTSPNAHETRKSENSSSMG